MSKVPHGRLVFRVMAFQLDPSDADERKRLSVEAQGAAMIFPPASPAMRLARAAQAATAESPCSIETLARLKLALDELVRPEAPEAPAAPVEEGYDPRTGNYL